ncbi:hypothetical protein CLIB1444_01S09802 [[Candida] jaroonii]|uniref:Uncharacterized protein n=1 Tax=[Candida] jaroonii TaxID=467808 RepID=A0ACA9Y1B9_9ASCO|nr:hypothetical protein CLIB1444_01S09802 [[Candida] jaroonii]
MMKGEIIKRTNVMRLLKIISVIIVVINIIYFTRVYSLKEQALKQQALKHVKINYDDDDIEYSINKNYNELNDSEKISYLLHLVESDKQRFWLAQTSITEPNLIINPQDFLPAKKPKSKDNTNANKKGGKKVDVVDEPNEETKKGEDEKIEDKNQEKVEVENGPKGNDIPESSNDIGKRDEDNWVTKPTLFYDPRLTLSIYLDEIKHQFLKHNPNNEKSKDHLVTVPFSWQDWVDLTLLNEELSRPIDERLNCDWLQEEISKPTKHPDFCKNLKDLSDDELNDLNLPKSHLPGFIVKGSPMNKTPQKQAMMLGKAHLLTHQENPLSLIFLTKNGTYEVQIDEKKKLVDTPLVKNFLKRNKLEGDSIILNPIHKFNELETSIEPRKESLEDDIHKMHAITHQTFQNASRELYLDPEVFNYKTPEVVEQIQEYEVRLNKMRQAVTNELHFDKEVIEANRLSRHESNHYNSLKYANDLSVKEETTYYKLATLLTDENNKDTGWHYEWRFFNGALRYVKEGWTAEQLEIREQIILDRLLRNWFKFTEEKGIISWIAHGPLLSWYWDGLMFPYDIDVDIQMPASELNRLSKNYNMTLVIEDINEGYGKYLIDCSTFLHHRDKALKDNFIDARFIDIDTGTYIDITGLGKNDEPPPPEQDSYIRSKNANDESVELYMDRRKHWLTFEQINPLRYSSIGGVPVYVPNDIMSMLNHEYAKGTKSYKFHDYYYIPILRLWLKKDDFQILLQDRNLNELNKKQTIDLLQNLELKDKVRLLETNDNILTEYYLTHNHTQLHEVEKKFMLDPSLQFSITDLRNNFEYHHLTSKFKMGKPLRKALFDYEYIERLKYVD